MKNKLPWLNEEVQHLIEKRNSVARQLKKTGIVQLERDKLAAELKSLRKQIKSRIRPSRSIKDEGTVALASNNHKSAWR